MKRYLFIIILFVCAAVPMTAQYYSVNYDKRTVAEMTACAAANYRCFSTSSIILYNYLLAAFFY